MKEIQKAHEMERTGQEAKASPPLEGVRPSYLLGLPPPILDEIILQLRRLIKYDGYLCELRLVCSDFNEAILRCLVFKDAPRRFFPHHFRSCTKRCSNLRCKNYGEYNPTYSRHYLQAAISRQREEDLELLGNYNNLHEALKIFRDDLTLPESLFTTTRTFLESNDLFPCASINPIFSDKTSTLLCEAALRLTELFSTEHLHDILLRYHPWPRPPELWVKNLACFVGDLELLTRHWSGNEVVSEHQEPVVSEVTELLAMSAMRGHSALFRHLISLMEDVEHVYWPSIFRGAMYSGNTQIMEKLLHTAPEREVPQLCLQALNLFRVTQSLPSNYLQVALQMLERALDNSLWTKDGFHALCSQIELQSFPIIQGLLLRYHDYTTLGLSGERLADKGPLWLACFKGDLECVRLLFQAGYARPGYTFPWMQICFRRCVEAAICANSFLIVQELQNYLSDRIHDIFFDRLAAVDGSIPTMIECLKHRGPDWLDMAVIGETLRPDTYGQQALRSAVQWLRVENVKFLLDKGIRSGEPPMRDFKIEWRYKRAHEIEFDAVQKLVREYGLPQIEIEL